VPLNKLYSRMAKLGIGCQQGEESLKRGKSISSSDTGRILVGSAQWQEPRSQGTNQQVVMQGLLVRATIEVSRLVT